MTSSNIDWKPRIGMEFNDMEEAYQFWLMYSARVGFGVRKRYANKSKKDGTILSCRFVCCKEGLRKKTGILVTKRKAETRTDCKARITLLLKNGKIVIHEFIEDHNHPLQLPETTHMLSSHRKITEVQAHEIDMAVDSGLRQKLTFQLMSTNVGHRANLGYTRLDVKNYLNAKRQRSMLYGEAGCLSQYFQQQLLENPSFFHAYQMDIDEQITNVFWCDANMVLDYGHFGDVMSFDTTGSVIFGAALLYDETIESFKWLFETFLQAHNQKKPKTVFTDQAQAMAVALAEVMPETKHGLCTWHLSQNGIKHLGNLMKEGSCILRDFKRCMYDIDVVADFETAWTDLIKEYNVSENKWIKSLYAIKEKWASCYMKESFTLGMRSTQLSESLNSHFKSCMKPNVDIIRFFKHFEQVVDEKRGKELTCEYESLHKLPMLISDMSQILVQMAKLYTHTVFELFQNEFKIFLGLCISERNESQSLCQYVITMVNHSKSWMVSFDRVSTSISCSCKKFETFGILCSHALKVFEANDVKEIPEKYILRRWTREARCGVVQDLRGKDVEGDPKLSSTRRFRQVVSKFIKVAADASIFEEHHKIVDDGVDDLCKKIMKLRLNVKSNESHDNDNPKSLSNVMQPKGFKYKSGLKGRTRKKSWVELQSKRTKRCPRRRQPRTQISQDKELPSQLPDGVSCSAPPSYKPPQTQEDRISYTELLMATLNDTDTTMLYLD